MNKRFQVAIVGGGPVGLGLALDLGLRGIKCVLIERRTRHHRIPRGQNLTQRTLEHFYFWGIVDQLRAARVMPPGYPIGNVNAYRSLTSEYWHAHEGRETVRRYFFQDNERLPQYQTEDVLRSKLATVPSVEQRFGWTASRLEQDDKSVRLDIADENGAKETIEADYLVGCDGAHSTIRAQVGIERGGTDFDQVMMLAVFRSPELHERLKRFPERSTYRVMDPALNGYWQFFGRIDVGNGFFFHSPVPAEAAQRKDFDFQGVLEKATGFKFKAEFDHLGFWDLRVAVADKYQVGRVLIAGDAAHSHPPYGGFGLNNGLEDARNLGWKLWGALAGWGGAGLVPSYSEERRPVFKETGEDFIASRIEAEGKFLNTYDPAIDREAFEAAWKQKEIEDGRMAARYEPNFEGSSVIFGPPDGKCSAHGAHMLKARPGHHLTPQPLSNGRDIYEELCEGFTLLAFDVDDKTVAAFEAAAKTLGIPFKAIRDTYADGRQDYESKLVLVRPDQYVVWTANAAPASAEAVLRKAVGKS
ncbi:FAD-dependent monooxygenase [Methylocella sp. CPCC 101449]|uniref:FAD-dependent monooxygenase n=1 Tax=Methylocella sp. CPCC 101449 TaxID=2987531 RepID=UPI0028907313|nr:FAD-dependent monooxygenase [Methylocella sp. CPCC 101449]MDT2021646.1 FAD-dependent monooxygenase [Methylocella sp. CPCC 101449]